MRNEEFSNLTSLPSATVQTSDCVPVIDVSNVEKSDNLSLSPAVEIQTSDHVSVIDVPNVEKSDNLSLSPTTDTQTSDNIPIIEVLSAEESDSLALSLFVSNHTPVINVSHTDFNLNYLWYKAGNKRVSVYSDLVISSLRMLNSKTTKWEINESIIPQLNTDEFENDYNEKLEFIPNFKLKQRSSISNFFASHMIDIPRCLKTSYSLYKPIYELPHLKFLNILMRRGYKEKIFTTILKIFIKNTMHPSYSSLNNTTTYSWLTLVPVFNSTLLINQQFYSSLSLEKVDIDGRGEQFIENRYLEEHPELTMSQFLSNSLERYKPTFIFKVQKIDKSTRKHSRGKSGKYVILWKYVPVYKRLYTVLRWLIRDITFQKAHKFEIKFWQALNLVLSASSNSLIIKFRNFNHNFVFKNFKKTLLQTLRTVS